MSKLVRFGVSREEYLLVQFDRLAANKALRERTKYENLYYVQLININKKSRIWYV
jgi:hypothetical protein